MKILILTHAAGTPNIGPNMRTFYLGRNLVEQGHEVHIVGSGNFHKYRESPLKDQKFTKKIIQGICYYWLATYKYKKRNYQQVINQLSFLFQLIKKRKKWLQIEPQVVLVSSPHPFGIYIGHYIANKCNAKLIFEIRDLWPEIILELGNFKKNHPYIYMVRKAVTKAYKVADGVISVKPGDLDFIKNKYKFNGITGYIPNGFDHKSILDEEFTHPILSEDSFKIIYTGALSEYYAIEFLLFAADRLKHTHPYINIIIVGDGDNKKDYEEIKNQRDLYNVTFLGFLPKKYMLSIIRQGNLAYLGLRYTKANKFGVSTNKLFEYMYAKKPVLASYSTDHDLVKISGCGLSVDAESSDSIYNAILNIYNMTPDSRNKMGEKGYNYLLEKHTFEQITNEYIEFIDTI